MKNRIPAYLLIILLAGVLIWRIANPPAPHIPGPLGAIPIWTSMVKAGDMSASAVNSAESVWAGAWNNTVKSGVLESAVYSIDLNAKESHVNQLKDGSFVPNIGFKDDKTIWALNVFSKDPLTTKKSELVFINALDGETNRTQSLKTPIAAIIAWPEGSDKFVAQLAGVENEVKVAVFTESGDLVGNTSAIISSNNDFKLGQTAAMSEDGRQFMFSTSDGKGNSLYYFVNSQDNTTKHIISEQLPGRVEGIWLSDAGALIVCSEFEKFKRLIYNTATGKLEDLKSVDLKNWPGAPKSMMFVTYSGGYDFDLASGKAKKLFDYSNLSREDDFWRGNVQGGRLYPRKDGDYTSISTIGGTVDIRILNKDGLKPRNLLPRN